MSAVLDDSGMDRMVGIAASALWHLAESGIDDRDQDMVVFGISYMVGAMSLGEDHAPMSNGDVAQAGHDLIMAYIARLEAEAEKEES